MAPSPTRQHHHRASSTPSSPSEPTFPSLTKTHSVESSSPASRAPPPPAFSPSSSSISIPTPPYTRQPQQQPRDDTAATSRGRNSRHNKSNSNNKAHRSKSEATSSHSSAIEKRQRQQGAAATIHPSPFQPRLAVVLNVPSPWHPWLFLSRLLSIVPALWWGLPSLAHLILRVLPGQHVVIVPSSFDQGYAWGGFAGGEGGAGDYFQGRYALTEAGLATIWCFASGYLSFFFTDCLMSRWLINYTPQATIVRLLAINAVNAYVTSTFLSLAGGFDDPRLLLPGWISIATTLTIAYHITHQKINIRKETSTSINVFSIASYISMVVLLIYRLIYTPNYPAVPLVTKGKVIWDRVALFVEKVQKRVEAQRGM